MKHAMAISANGSEIIDRIYQVFFAVVGNLPEVVDFDEAFSDAAVRFAEVESANSAVVAMVFDAGLTGARAAVIGLGRYGLRATLGILTNSLRGEGLKLQGLVGQDFVEQFFGDLVFYRDAAGLGAP